MLVPPDELVNRRNKKAITAWYVSRGYSQEDAELMTRVALDEVDLGENID